MELYALDNNFDPYDLVENYTSCIWTERYSSYGDFEMELPLNDQTFRTFKVGRYLHLPTSSRLMMMETIRRTKNSEGLSMMKASGRSLEALLENRLVIHNETDGWRSSGPVAHLATQLVNRICILGSERSTYDIIPNLRYLDQDSGSSDEEVQMIDEDLYSAVKELCEMDDYGFRIFFNPDNKRLTFRAYSGTDRSVGANAVTFSPDLENLFDLSYLKSSVEFKNVAYVSHDDRSNVLIVYRPGHENVSGINRRVLMVNANDIENPTTRELSHRGRQELAKHNRQNLFDGQIEMNETYHRNTFEYGSDYSLGSIVNLDDGEGTTAKARVIEYIRSYNNEGRKSYPTLRTL